MRILAYSDGVLVDVEVQDRRRDPFSIAKDVLDAARSVDAELELESIVSTRARGGTLRNRESER